MKHARYASPQVHILSDAFHPCSIVEVATADCLAHDVPIHARATLLHLHSLHDINKLRAHLSHFFQRLDVNEVLLSPLAVIFVHFPLLVDVEKRQVIRLRHLEVLPSCITFLLTVLRSEENGGHRKHRHDREDLT